MFLELLTKYCSVITVVSVIIILCYCWIFKPDIISRWALVWLKLNKTEQFCFNLYMENWESCWFRLVKGGATFSKISQVSYMWTRLIAVSISDWVNLDHLRISTFCWTKPRIQRFPHSYSFRICSIIRICALVCYLSQNRTRY